MKLPHGFVYAILIIVGILAVSLYTRSVGFERGQAVAVKDTPPSEEAPPAKAAGKPATPGESNSGKNTSGEPESDARSTNAAEEQKQ